MTLPNAMLIASQTAVHFDWLLGDDPDRPIIDWYGNPYTQETFDARQRELGKRDCKSEAHLAAVDFAKCCGLVGAILLLTTQRGERELGFQRIREGLVGVYHDFDKTDTDKSGLLFRYLACRPTVTRPDVRPILDTWEARMKRYIADKNRGS